MSRRTPQEICEDEKWHFGRSFLINNFYFCWAGIALLLVGILMGRESAVLGQAMDTLSLLLFGTLTLLVGGKGWKDFAQMKWGGKTNATS